MSPDGGRVWTGSRVEGIAEIDTKSKRVRTYGSAGQAMDLALSPDGRTLFIAGSHSGLKQLDLDTGRLRTVSPLPCPWSLALSSDPKRLLVFYRCGGPGGSRARDVLDILDLETLRRVATISGLPMVGNQVELSVDGRQIWLLDADACLNYTYDRSPCPELNRRLLHVFQFPELTKIRMLSLTGGHHGALAFTPDGSQAVITGTETRVLKTGAFAATELFASSSPLYRVVFSPDGRSAFGLLPQENQVAVFDVDEGLSVRTGLASLWAGDGTADDAEENFHGAMHNGASFRPGLKGMAFQFDGRDDFLWFEKHRIHLMEGGAAAFTVWVKFDSVEGEMTILDALGDYGFRLLKKADHAWQVCLDAGNLGGCSGNSAPAILAASKSAAAPHTWYFLAVVITPEDIRLYVDGALDANQQNTIGVIHGGTMLQIGASKLPLRSPRLDRPEIEGFTRASYFHGLIDEVARYRRALTPDEIQTIAREPRPGAGRAR
jgi:hypothetical protein